MLPHLVKPGHHPTIQPGQQCHAARARIVMDARLPDRCPIQGSLALHAGSPSPDIGGVPGEKLGNVETIHRQSASSGKFRTERR
jgi:hypothetical protein